MRLVVDSSCYTHLYTISVIEVCHRIASSAITSSTPNKIIIQTEKSVRLVDNCRIDQRT
jgi:hypothetical protein